MYKVTSILLRCAATYTQKQKPLSLSPSLSLSLAKVWLLVDAPPVRVAGAPVTAAVLVLDRRGKVLPQGRVRKARRPAAPFVLALLPVDVPKAHEPLVPWAGADAPLGVVLRLLELGVPDLQNPNVGRVVQVAIAVPSAERWVRVDPVHPSLPRKVVLVLDLDKVLIQVLAPARSLVEGVKVRVPERDGGEGEGVAASVIVPLAGSEQPQVLDGGKVLGNVLLVHPRVGRENLVGQRVHVVQTHGDAQKVLAVSELLLRQARVPLGDKLREPGHRVL
mmetsp:Transcript_1390/g.4388  ORF Transcript_1390/g.4388 Transcript_1390/m.4388 type:complete len:277 (-) Transcript_1390:471-1301(-)